MGSGHHHGDVHGHDHDHDHGHGHSRDHDHPHGEPVPAHLDLNVPDSELTAGELTRRRFLRGAGLLGAAVTGAQMMGLPRLAAAAVAGSDPAVPIDRLQWLAGDHHIHTQYSPDAMYTVNQQASRGAQNGLDWLVITDHGGVAHQKYSVPLTHADVLAARAALRDTLVFQGLEWNIPSAEHGTVMMAPGDNEIDLLTTFELLFDGTVNNANSSSPAHEALAVQGIQWLGRQVAAGKTAAALFLANHPARRGLDSPHEFRGWHDADPTVAVGMEGAPGHQADGIASPTGPGIGRGAYDNAPTVNSFAPYPPESYVTHGGFDWFTARVGGLWDSLLSEGPGWWITANSDSHKIYRDTLVNPTNNNSTYFNGTGKYPDPVDGGVPRADYGDFAPGFYSRTLVGATGRSYLAVMEAIRAGRVWVCHGDLIRGLDVRVIGSSGLPVTLGGRAAVRRGETAVVQIAIDVNTGLNNNGDRPQLRRVDLIAGPVVTPGSDRDQFLTDGPRVVRSFDVSRGTGRIVLQHAFTDIDGPFYLRIRGTDANFVGTATAQDPTPPRVDPMGHADPWSDLWFYANPVFVDVVDR